MCAGVRAALCVEFGGVWIVIGAGRLARWAFVIIFDVMAVSETIVLVLVPVVRGLGFSAGVGHGVACQWTVGLLLHVCPCLLLPISTAIVGAVDVLGVAAR